MPWYGSAVFFGWEIKKIIQGLSLIMKVLELVSECDSNGIGETIKKTR